MIETHKEHKTYGYRNIAEQIKLGTGWVISVWFIHLVFARETESVHKQENLNGRDQEVITYNFHTK